MTDNPPSAISIETGARLHFGPLSYLPEKGRHFGGIGLMVRQPGVLLQATRQSNGESAVTGSIRAKRFLHQILSDNSDLQTSVRITIEKEIPPHQGLGSGTQLGLAVAEAVFLLNHCNFSNTIELAQQVGRGKRSAIGIFGYEHGGFLIEAGQAQPNEIGALSCRVPFPEEWSMELISLQEEDGMHGEVETKVFQQLAAMPESLSGKLCHIALTQMLPAIGQQDAPSWCAALDEYGQRIGQFFADSQGGIYSTAIIRDLVQHLRKNKITGIAQSSWGPTISVFCPQEQREELHRLLQSHPAAASLRVQTAVPLNSPRILSMID